MKSFSTCRYLSVAGLLCSCLMFPSVLFGQTPVITSISPTQVTPGGQMTITGSGFGASEGNNGDVALYNTYPSVVSWSDTQIVVTVPANVMPGNA